MLFWINRESVNAKLWAIKHNLKDKQFLEHRRKWSLDTGAHIKNNFETALTISWAQEHVFCKLRIYFVACFAIARAFLFLNKIVFCSLNTGAFGYTKILIALFIQIKFFVNVE